MTDDILKLSAAYHCLLEMPWKQRRQMLIRLLRMLALQKIGISMTEGAGEDKSHQG